MKGKTGDFARLQHILDAINEIEEYSKDRNFFDFINNSMFRFACIKQLELIGEAANHISIEARENFPEIEWLQIIAMRNVFIHEYFGIDLNVVWQIIESDIPELKLNILKLIEKLS